MGVVFVENETKAALEKTDWFPIDNPESQELIEKMQEEKLLVEIGYNELGDYREIQESLSSLPVAILYLLLTDQCNFDCRYCFLGGGVSQGEKDSWMNPEIVKRGVDLFARTLEGNSEEKHVHPKVIFYGGEPFLNFGAMRVALEYIDELKEKEKLPRNLQATANTNASVINEKIAEVLAKHKVSISVSLDGRKEVHDRERVLRSGKGTFEQTIQGLKLLKEYGVGVSISCTITESGVDQLEDSLNYFIDDLGIKGLGFNIAREGEGARHADSETYIKAASEALIKCFRIAREKGVYEDRMMRKVKAMVNRKPHVNDCGACGQQIVIAPSGEVGICHAAVKSKAYFTENTPDLDPQTHPDWVEWRKRSPFNMDECIDCVALGVCGGGCPYEVYRSHSILKCNLSFSS